MDIINKILELLESNNRSQKELTDYLGIEKSIFSAWKSGKSQSYKKYIDKIAQYFDVSTDFLTGKSKYRNIQEIKKYNWGIYDSGFEPAFDFAELLIPIKKARVITTDELGKAINVDEKTMENVLNGLLPITYKQAEDLCKVLNTDVSQVLFDNGYYQGNVPDEYKNRVKEWELRQKGIGNISIYEAYDNLHPIQLKKIPLLGEIACGEPIWADEDKEHYVMADMDIDADFCLTAKGDSMVNARINNGDIVFIKQMTLVQNGEIAAVIIDNEATLKRVYYYPDKNKLVLNPENPAYEPLIYINEELDTVRILGKAVYFMSAL